MPKGKKPKKSSKKQKNVWLQDFQSIKYFLELCDSLIGKKGVYTLNTNILDHAEGYVEEEDLSDEGDVYLIGREDKLIKFEDIKRTFDDILADEDILACFNSGRSFHFEGYQFVDDNTVELLWGS